MNEHRGLWRGKSVDNGAWVEGLLTDRCNEEGFAVIQSSDYWEHDVDPSTLGECTGLTDKNDKPIFEGDRVSVPMYRSECGNLYEINDTGTVEWHKGAFDVVWDDELYGRHFLGYLEDVEVIGNIHDNSELLNATG